MPSPPPLGPTQLATTRTPPPCCHPPHHPLPRTPPQHRAHRIQLLDKQQSTAYPRAKHSSRQKDARRQTVDEWWTHNPLPLCPSPPLLPLIPRSPIPSFLVSRYCNRFCTATPTSVVVGLDPSRWSSPLKEGSKRAGCRLFCSTGLHRVISSLQRRIRRPGTQRQERKSYCSFGLQQEKEIARETYEAWV